jgi:dephospho-CoA kinase
MKVWVVTGPAGAGKSAVTSLLAAAGAAVVDGDRLGHELLARPAIQAAIAARIDTRYVVDGVVDRAALGERVFRDPVALAELDAITHGPLGDLARVELARLAAAGRHELAVFEAAVYFRLPSPPPADLVVAVVAAPEIRVRRLVARAAGRLSLAAARARVAAQQAMDSLWRQADELIVNEGSRDELEAQVRRLVARPATGREPLP